MEDENVQLTHKSVLRTLYQYYHQELLQAQTSEEVSANTLIENPLEPTNTVVQPPATIQSSDPTSPPPVATEKFDAAPEAVDQETASPLQSVHPTNNPSGSFFSFIFA